MTGFKPQGKVFKLRFADPELNGLEVVTGSASIGDMLRLQELADRASTEQNAANGAALTNAMITLFCRALRSWNLLDENDQEVPATIEGALSQDTDLVMAVIKAWMEAVNGVSAPLADGSPYGASALEASLPMETLSSSPVS